MAITKETAAQYIALLHHELAVAEGCTEPIAVAYAAALCVRTLGAFPEKLQVTLSGNIIKNARCAVVPNTGGLRGMRAAAIAGAVGGDATRALEVIAGLNAAHIQRTNELMAENFCTIALSDLDETLHILVEGVIENNTCTVEIKRAHTHVHRITKNGEIVFDAKDEPESVDTHAIYENLRLSSIYDFAANADISPITALLEKQISCNIAICEEGLRRKYGAGIGRLLLSTGSDLETRACAYAAAGSDARMSGCPMPVVINSGSGNQGITVTAPVWVYAQFRRCGKEKLLRALTLSNLTALYQKKKIGKLSAYCGAVSAACGSAAGVTYLCGGTRQQIEATLSNAAVICSGMLCDGAKPSCAAKIASSVHAGLLAHKMAMAGDNFLPGDGLVGCDAEQTVWNIGYLASEGLIEVDKLMLKLMIEQC